MPRQDEFLKKIRERKSEPVDWKITREIPSEDTETDKSPPDLLVVWRWKGTKELAEPMTSGAMVAQGTGDLLVVMRRVDGRWYWNPFGW